MTETSKLKKYLMWYKVIELFSKGLNFRTTPPNSIKVSVDERGGVSLLLEL